MTKMFAMKKAEYQEKVSAK